MTGLRVSPALRGAPVTLSCAVVLGFAGWWAFHAGGFAVRQWAPAGLAVVGLLLVALFTVPNRWSEVPVAVRLAAGGLLGYAAWSFASIAWASDPGYALEGASRTLLYALTFCLFALWPQRGGTSAVLLAGWTAVLGIAGIVLAIRLAQHVDLTTLFKDDRLRAPTGYPNATAALLMMPVLPAVVLAAGRRVPWWARGGFAAVAVTLASVSLLTESRGAVFSTPIVVLALFVLVPGRLRHLLALAPVALAVALAAPQLVDVSVAVTAGEGHAAILSALRLVALLAVAAGLVVAVAAWLEGRRPVSAHTAARASRVAGVAVAVGLIAALIVGVALVGDPVDRVDNAWTSFKGGYEANDAEANRLVGGLGSSRYDFYRVGLRSFRDRPLAGVGADGFYQVYLREGTSGETPRYPHSLEVRTLMQTGVVGALLLFGALTAALVAAMGAMRRGSSRRRMAAAGATLAFVYWFVHGSVDWFWEWGGLGLPAFALLGLAASLSRLPGSDPSEGVTVRKNESPRGGSRRLALPVGPARRTTVAVVGAVGAVVLALPFAMLWTADAQQRRAAKVYVSDPLGAYRLLDRAAGLNPLAAAPETLAGSIALRYGDLTRADSAFERALKRVPADQYATLQRGAIASAQGRPADAQRLLTRAAELAPRDELTRDVLRVVRRGGTIDIDELTRRILAAAANLTS